MRTKLDDCYSGNNNSPNLKEHVHPINMNATTQNITIYLCVYVYLILDTHILRSRMDNKSTYTIDHILNACSSHTISSTSSHPSLPLNLSKSSTIIHNQQFLWRDKQHHLTATLFGPTKRLFLPHQMIQRQNRGPRRQRTTFTHEQTLRLEMEYHLAEYISRGKRFQLADILDLTENQIKIWFQNRRAKDKRIEKAIMEQQYRFISTQALSEQMTITNCTTCNYTKQQFNSSSPSSSK